MATEALLQRWLYLVCGAHVAIGVAMPWLSQLPQGTAYVEHLAQAFGVAPLTAQTGELLRWLLTLLGAMIAGWGVLMAGLVRLACRNRQRAPLDLLALALLGWAALDMAWSASRGVWLHLWLDGLALLAILVPAFLLRRRFGEHPAA